MQEDEISDHKMHSEWYSISEETARRIRETKAAGHRVIAVGTTSCRTLEAAAAKYGEIKACSGNTSIFLYPGVKFNCIDGLITNFHLPESTLIMLVSALYGYEKTMHAYEVAVADEVPFLLLWRCYADSLIQNSRFFAILYVKGKDAICIRRSLYNYGRPLL